MKIGFGKRNKEYEEVENPYHYTVGKMPGWDVIELIIDHMPLTPNEGGLLWNCLKYLIRFPFKGSPIKDLNKARKYLDKFIEKYTENDKNGVRSYEEVE